MTGEEWLNQKRDLEGQIDNLKIDLQVSGSNLVQAEEAMHVAENDAEAATEEAKILEKERDTAERDLRLAKEEMAKFKEVALSFIRSLEVTRIRVSAPCNHCNESGPLHAPGCKLKIFIRETESSLVPIPPMRLGETSPW